MPRFGRSFPMPRLKQSLLSSSVSIAVSVLTATFSLIAPTVTTTQNVTISPSVFSAIFSIPTPTISVGDSVTPAPVEATFSIPTPTVVIGDAISVITLTATFTLIDPTVITENMTGKAQVIISSSEVKPIGSIDNENGVDIGFDAPPIGAFTGDDNRSMIFTSSNNEPKASMV